MVRLGYTWSGHDPAKTKRKSGSGINSITAVTSEIWFKEQAAAGRITHTNDSGYGDYDWFRIN